MVQPPFAHDCLRIPPNLPVPHRVVVVSELERAVLFPPELALGGCWNSGSIHRQRVKHIREHLHVQREAIRKICGEVVVGGEIGGMGLMVECSAHL